MMPKPVHLILLVGAAMLGGAATIWIAGDKRWTPPPPRLPDASLYQLPSSPGARFALAPEESLAARPLFSESRRPPAPDVAEGASKDEPDPLRDVKVLGLFGSGAEGGGVFQVAGKVIRLRVGESIGPWVLRSVSGLRLELSRKEGGRATLELKHQPQPAGPVAPPAAPARAVEPQAEPKPGVGAGGEASPSPRSQSDALPVARLDPAVVEAPSNGAIRASQRN